MGTDLLGFGSNATNVRTARPADTRVFGGVDTWGGDCSSPTAGDGTRVPAATINGLLAQLRQLIRQAAVTEDNTDDLMVWKAVVAAISANGAIHKGTDTGPVNTITATVSPAISAYADGQVFEITPAYTTTSVAPVANFSTIGIKTITHADGSALLVGEIVAGAKTPLAYDAVLGKMVLLGVPKAYADAQRLQPWFRLSGTPNNIPSGVRTVLTGWAASASGNTTGTLNAGAGTFTVGASDAGTWVIEMCANTSIASSEEAAGISVNGAIVTQMGVANGAAAVNDLDMACSCIVRLAVGDVVAATYYQGSASAAAMNSNGNNHVAGVRVGV